MPWIDVRPTLVTDEDGYDLYIRYTPYLVWLSGEMSGPFYEEHVGSSKEKHEQARMNARKAMLDKLEAMVKLLLKEHGCLPS